MEPLPAAIAAREYHTLSKIESTVPSSTARLIALSSPILLNSSTSYPISVSSSFSALMVLVPVKTMYPTQRVPATQSAGPMPVSAKTSPATSAMG